MYKSHLEATTIQQWVLINKQQPWKILFLSSTNTKNSNPTHTKTKKNTVY